jgi:hypothetical protein
MDLEGCGEFFEGLPGAPVPEEIQNVISHASVSAKIRNAKASGQSSGSNSSKLNWLGSGNGGGGFNLKRNEMIQKSKRIYPTPHQPAFFEGQFLQSMAGAFPLSSRPVCLTVHCNHSTPFPFHLGWGLLS